MRPRAAPGTATSRAAAEAFTNDDDADPKPPAAPPQGDHVAELHRIARRLVLFAFLADAASMGFALLAGGWRP